MEYEENYLKGTLFEVNDAENENQEKLDTSVTDQTANTLNTTTLLEDTKESICRSPQSYESIFINYFYEMKLPVVQNEDGENIFLFPNTLEKIEEISEMKAQLSSCQIILSTALYHSVEWLMDILNTKLPQRKGINFLPSDLTSQAPSCYRKIFVS